jgi:hypothetical protein
MDRNLFWGALIIVFAMGGCNQPGQPTGDPSSSAGATGAQSTSSLGATPEKAVAEFLEAVRTGNDESAAALLTPTARQKTAEENLAVAPPGRPTAKFTVGKVEYVTASKDGAHVLSSWSDTNEDGSVRTDEIIWVLRKEPEGWRIVGSVMKIFPDKDPLVLNYEDPQDMKRKLQMLYAEELTPEGQQSPVQNGQPQATAPNTAPPVIR